MRIRSTAIAAAAMIMLAACGQDADANAATPRSSTSAPTTSAGASTADTSGPSPSDDIASSGSIPEAPTDTSSTTFPSPPTTASIIYAEDPGIELLRVTGVQRDSSLNVRLTPGVDGERLGAFAAESWHILPTRRVATVDGELWRELRLPSGATGWAHSDYLSESTSDCAVERMADPAFENTARGDVDGDGIDDVVSQLGTADSELVVRIDYGNGASTDRVLGSLDDVLLSQISSFSIDVYDLDGDGVEEIAFSSGNERGHDTVFYSARECDIVTSDPVINLTTWSSSAVSMSFACVNPRSPNVEVHQLLGRADGNGGFSEWTISPFAFDDDTGIVRIGPDYVIDHATMQETYIVPCAEP